MEEKVQKFLNRLTHNGKYEQVIDTFSNGCCYYASIMLHERFLTEAITEIMYDDIANHFGCLIDDRIYDITGDVTNKYDWQYWPEFALQDKLLTDRIIRDCIDF